MRRSLVVLAIVAAPLLARAEFRFPVPPGWVDLSPGAPAANFEGLAPDFVKTLRSGQFRAFAFDVAHTERGFTPNFNAVAMDPPTRVTEANEADLAQALFGPIQKQMAGAALVEKGIVEVGGVKSLRIVYDSEMGGTPLRQMAVLVPGVPNTAVVTYTALRDQFASLRPAFEAHVARIEGAREDGGVSIVGPVARDGLVGALVGAAVGLGAGFVTWRRKRAARSSGAAASTPPGGA